MSDVDPLELFGDWWLIFADGSAEQVRNVVTDNDHYFDVTAGRLDVRGPFPTLEQAEERRWRDDIPSYWEHNLDVYATHCGGCGKYAERIAGSDVGGGWHWQVTYCKKCGFIDSRVPKEA